MEQFRFVIVGSPLLSSLLVEQLEKTGSRCCSRQIMAQLSAYPLIHDGNSRWKHAREHRENPDRSFGYRSSGHRLASHGHTSGIRDLIIGVWKPFSARNQSSSSLRRKFRSY